MTRAAVVLAVVSALCLGSAFGFAGGVLFSRHILHDDLHMGARWGLEARGFGIGRRGPMGPGGPHGMPSARMLAPHLQRLLDLSPEQTDAIRVEIERSRDDFATVRDSLHARIERHLTPQQRERWRRIMRDRFPGEPGGDDLRPHRAVPGSEGEQTR